MGKHKPETRAKWRADNREHILAYAREYNRRYYLAHRERILEKNREWNKQNACTEEYKSKHRERKRRYYRAYYQKNKETLLAMRKVYYQAHIEEMRARNNEYYHSHRNERLVHQKARRSVITRQDIIPTPIEKQQTISTTPQVELQQPIRPSKQVEPKSEPRKTYDTNTSIGRLQHDTQQLYDDIAARVAEMEKLFDDWEWYFFKPHQNPLRLNE